MDLRASIHRRWETTAREGRQVRPHFRFLYFTFPADPLGVESAVGGNRHRFKGLALLLIVSPSFGGLPTDLMVRLKTSKGGIDGGRWIRHLVG